MQVHPGCCRTDCNCPWAPAVCQDVRDKKSALLADCPLPDNTIQARFIFIHSLWLHRFLVGHTVPSNSSPPTGPNDPRAFLGTFRTVASRANKAKLNKHIRRSKYRLNTSAAA